MFLNSYCAQLPAFPYRIPSFHETRPRRSMDTKVRVEDVIQEEELKMPLAIWIRRISSLELRTLNTRYQQLKQVYIERISHYRQDSAVAHELIILHLRSGNDTRIARLERLKLEQTPEGFW